MTKTLKELIELRKALLVKIDAILDKPEARDANGKETGDLSAEQRAALDSHKKELAELDKQVALKEEQNALREQQRALESRASQVVTPRYTETQGRFSPSQRRDIAQFSVPRLLSAMIEGRSLDGVEAEMMQEGRAEASQSSIQMSSRAVMVPSFALLGERRDMTATGQTTVAGDQGGMTIATMKAPLLDDLFNRNVLVQAGMTTYSGLVGNLDIPRLSKGTAPAHKAENAAADETSPTTSQLSLTPRRLPVFVDVSRQLFLQSQERNLDTAIRRHVIGQLNEIIQSKLINGAGSGSNEPRGILQTVGIGAGISLGAQGGAPTWAAIVDLETKVAIADADIGSLHYLSNAKVRGKLKTTPKVASTDSLMLLDDRNGGMLNGYVPLWTNGVPSTLAKSTSGNILSALIFGNFADLVMAQWSGIEFILDEVTQAGNGLIRLHAAIYYDGGVQRPVSFAASQEIATT